jgi:hypothetical protein
MIDTARMALFNAIKISLHHLIFFCPNEKARALADYLLM